MTAPTAADLAELAAARALLESPGIAVQIADLVGMPLEFLLSRQLPFGAGRLIDRAARSAVETACNAAVRTLGDDRPGRTASLRLHRFAVFGTGAIGGFFGLPGLLVELPLTTTAMLRSIADIGRVMQKETIAECAESESVRQRLIELGVDYAQGYAVDEPMPIETSFQPGAQRAANVA